MRKTFWIILSSVFLGGATIFLSMFLLQDDMSEVEVISVRQGKLSETIFTTGVVEPKRVTRHYSPLSGIVSEVFINQNEPVTKGQILFELDTADFEKQLKIENVNLQLLLDEKRQQRINYVEKIKTQLAESGNAEALDEPPDLTAYDLKIKKSQLIIEDLESKLTQTKVTAEHDGIVTDVKVTKGQAVSQGEYALSISDVGELQVRAEVPELEAHQLATGMPAVLVNGATEERLSGHIDYVSPVVTKSEKSPNTSVVEILLVTDINEVHLKVGNQLNIEIDIEQKEQLLIPSSAVFFEGGRSYVFRVNNQVLEKVEILTGRENDQWVEVLEGLAVGDELIREATDGQKEGSKVKVLYESEN